MNLYETIYSIVDKFGKDVVAERRFIYMVADYYSFRDNPAERHILTTIVDEGHSESLLNIDSGDIENVINKIKFDVCRSHGYREDIVMAILTPLAKVIYGDIALKGEKQEKSFTPNFTVKGVAAVETQSQHSYFLKSIITYQNKKIILYDAVGEYSEVDGTFVILKDSLLNIQTGNLRAYITEDGNELGIMNKSKYSKSYLIRKRVLDQHCILKKPRYYLVKTNIICSTPSEAAFIVTGKNTNGMNCWRELSGRSLKEVINSKRQQL